MHAVKLSDVLKLFFFPLMSLPCNTLSSRVELVKKEQSGVGLV